MILAVIFCTHAAMNEVVETPTPSPDPSAPRRRKFRCNVCQRNFNRREHMQRHMAIHYGQKPFNCPNCDYACRRRDLLNRHIRLSHDKQTREGATPNDHASAAEEHGHLGVEDAGPAHCLGVHSGPAGEHPIALPPPGPEERETIDSLSSYINTGQQVPASQDTYNFLGPNPDTQTFHLNYLDNVALPFLVEQPALFPELPLNDLFSNSPLEAGNGSIQPEIDTASLDKLDGTPALAAPPDVGRHHVYLAPFLRVSQDDWLWLYQEVARFSDVLPPGYTLPSRHAISRYLHGFLNGFHPHFPIIHPQTLAFKAMAPELILALAAVGSQYCLESHQGLKLFRLARSIATEQIRLRDLDENRNVLHKNTDHTSHANRTTIPLPHPSDSGLGSEPCLEGPWTPDNGSYGIVETMQALFYLMAMATWGGNNRSLVRQAIATQSILAVLVRQHGLTDAGGDDDASVASDDSKAWNNWAQAESARRTKLIIFCFFNLHTIVFNLPSPLMMVDVQLRLPCAETEWKASNPHTWRELHQQSHPAPFFQHCISDLLQDGGGAPICSSLGSHVLIHALIQHIFSVRQATRLETTGGLSPGSFLTLRQALKKWQIGWELNPESSLSPLDKHGPIAFNSTALFHLANIRIVTDVGSARSLLTQNDLQIAQRLRDEPNLHRGSTLVLAARHATVALCSPVQMGVYFVGRVPNWSVMHAVCSLEYAYILSQFLRATTAPNLSYPLQPDEQALLVAIKETLAEVESSRPDGDHEEIETKPHLLQSKAVRAWALILQGFRTWSAVDLITRALIAYADMLDLQVCEQ
ncbi:hypothetical protein BJY01DRAFT_226130 [Aspergillus pseudoustus]|uniref:C2H2-type domain-containing protein n=1 Tax=Aspergillus pseudoustus TaxID=1810923 RepID=A0ABR4IWU1_9EURO